MLKQDIRVWIEELTGMVETQMDENKGSLDAYHVTKNSKELFEISLCNFEFEGNRQESEQRRF